MNIYSTSKLGRIYHFLGIFFLLLFSKIALSQTTNDSMPSKPIEIYNDFNVTPILSKLNIPLNIDRWELEQSINKKIVGALYEDYSYTDNDNDNLMVKVLKTQDIRIGFYGQQINYTVPLNIWLKKKVAFTELEGTGEITIKFVTDFLVKDDWSLETKTHVESYEWNKAPVMKMTGFDVPIRYLADVVIDKSKYKLAAAIDAQVKSSLDLKKNIQETWNTMQKPILMSPDYKMWVKLTPKNMTMSPLVTDGNDIKSTISLETISDVSMGTKPFFRENSVLPPYMVAPATNLDSFSINLLTDIPYSEAEVIGQKIMVGQKFEQNGKNVTVEDLHIYGQGEKMVINTKLSGSLNGNIFLTGKPFFNPVTSSIEMKDVDFELESKNFLMKSAAWLFHRGIAKKMQNAIKIPVGDKMKEMQNLVQEKLKNYQFTNNIVMKGNLDHVSIDDIHLTPGSIRVVINSIGKLSLLVKGLD